jgi:hypothetical protein
MYPPCIAEHAKHIPSEGDDAGSAGSHVTGDEKIWLVPRLIDPVRTLEDFEMFRRITLLIPLLIMLSMSGCFFFPHGGGGGWHDHRYDGGGPGYYHR